MELPVSAARRAELVTDERLFFALDITNNSDKLSWVSGGSMTAICILFSALGPPLPAATNQRDKAVGGMNTVVLVFCKIIGTRQVTQKSAGLSVLGLQR